MAASIAFLSVTSICTEHRLSESKKGRVAAVFPKARIRLRVRRHRAAKQSAEQFRAAEICTDREQQERDVERQHLHSAEAMRDIGSKSAGQIADHEHKSHRRSTRNKKERSDGDFQNTQLIFQTERPDLPTKFFRRGTGSDRNEFHDSSENIESGYENSAGPSDDRSGTFVHKKEKGRRVGGSVAEEYFFYTPEGTHQVGSVLTSSG